MLHVLRNQHRSSDGHPGHTRVNLPDEGSGEITDLSIEGLIKVINFITKKLKTNFLQNYLKIRRAYNTS